jgi:hypothetical protein
LEYTVCGMAGGAWVLMLIQRITLLNKHTKK